MLLALLPIVVGATTERPPALREVGIDQRVGERVPLDLTFRDERGQGVVLGQYFGRRPVILSFAYFRCPMLCPLVMDGLVRALKALPGDVGDQFDVVTISIDPEDTPAQAAEKKDALVARYRRPGADAGWHFLTGDPASIERLARAAGFRYQRVAGSGELAHAAGILVLAPDGTIARYFFGVEYAPRDLRLGLVEAAAGRIGSPIDQLLLFCFRYDPSMGRYTPVVMNLVRLGGVLTVAGLCLFVALMRRRERQAAKGPGAGGAAAPPLPKEVGS